MCCPCLCPCLWLCLGPCLSVCCALHQALGPSGVADEISSHPLVARWNIQASAYSPAVVCFESDPCPSPFFNARRSSASTRMHFRSCMHASADLLGTRHSGSEAFLLMASGTVSATVQQAVRLPGLRYKTVSAVQWSVRQTLRQCSSRFNSQCDSTTGYSQCDSGRAIASVSATHTLSEHVSLALEA